MKGESMNSIDKTFYDFIHYLEKLSTDEIIINIKYHFTNLNPAVQKSLEDYFEKFNYWGSLNHQIMDYEEINRRAKSIHDHLNDFVWLYEHLKDYRSKKLLYAIISNWYRYDFKTLKECQEHTYRDYFDLDIVHCDNTEVLVDLGAFTGDSILDYLKEYNGAYKKIYAYEITPDSLNQLTKNLANYQNIEIRQKAVLDQKTTVYMAKSSVGPDANKIAPTGSIELKAVSLDSDIKEKITAIKMDIEGSEYLALKGAKYHIQNEHPKLLISVYHNHEDIWKIPKLIEEITPGYEFYLRYHGGNIFPTEVTLIAIYPAEKNKL